MSNYQVKTYTDTYLIYELKENATNSWVKLCPARGGIVIGFGVGGKELLYLDRETFLNPTANIRGGIPILFPISGPVENQSYEWDGRHYSMKQHGVARTLAWEVADTSEADGASVTLKLSSGPETLPAYPFDFELLFTYTLKDGELSIRQEYRNRTDRPMPMYAGFHPYFLADTKNIAYETDATEYLNMNNGQVRPYDGSLDIGEWTEAAILLHAQKPEIAFRPTADVRVRMKYDDAFAYIVLWSAAGKPFICVEPWMAKPGEMNRKQELTLVEPHGVFRAELTIGVE